MTFLLIATFLACFLSYYIKARYANGFCRQSNYKKGGKKRIALPTQALEV